jgi:hypothetical protein
VERWKGGKSRGGQQGRSGLVVGSGRWKVYQGRVSWLESCLMGIKCLWWWWWWCRPAALQALFDPISLARWPTMTATASGRPWQAVAGKVRVDSCGRTHGSVQGRGGQKTRLARGKWPSGMSGHAYAVGQAGWRSSTLVQGVPCMRRRLASSGQ